MAFRAGASASAAGYTGAPPAANPRGAQPKVAPGVLARAAAKLGLTDTRSRRRLGGRCTDLPENAKTRATRVAKDVSRIPYESILAATLSAIEGTYAEQDGTTVTLQALVNEFINAKENIIDKNREIDSKYFNDLLTKLQSFIDQDPDTDKLTIPLSQLLNLNNADLTNEAVLDELITEVVDPFIDTINSFLNELKDLVGEANPTGDDLTNKVSDIASKCAELKRSLEANISDLKDNIGEDVNKAFYSDNYHDAIEGLLSQNATTVEDLNKKVEDLNEKIEELRKLNNCKNEFLPNDQNKVETIRTSMVQEFKELIPKDINPNDIDKNIEIISQLLEIVSQDNGLFDDVEKPDVTNALKAALEEIASQIGSKVNDLNEKVNGNSEIPTIAIIKDHADEFSRLNTQVARLSALNIDLGTSQSSLSRIKAELIKQLFSLNLIENDGIEVGTIDDIKEIMSKLQASPNDLTTHLDTIANKFPELEAFVKSIEQCVDDYSDVSAQKTNLDDIETELTKLREIINQRAGSETEAFPGLNTLLAELKNQLEAIRKCEEPKGTKSEEDGSDTVPIILGVLTAGLCLYVGCCIEVNRQPNIASRIANVARGVWGVASRAWTGRTQENRPDPAVIGRV